VRQCRASTTANHGSVSPDTDLVEPQPKWTSGAETYVPCHQEERTGGEGVAGAGNGHRGRETQDALGQRRPQSEMGHDILGWPAERRKIETGREAPRPLLDQDHGAVGFGLVKSFMKGRSIGIEKTLTFPSSMATVLT
jgi:hypothetical protein